MFIHECTISAALGAGIPQQNCVNDGIRIRDPLSAGLRSKRGFCQSCGIGWSRNVECYLFIYLSIHFQKNMNFSVIVCYRKKKKKKENKSIAQKNPASVITIVTETKLLGIVWIFRPGSNGVKSEWKYFEDDSIGKGSRKERKSVKKKNEVFFLCTMSLRDVDNNGSSQFPVLCNS